MESPYLGELSLHFWEPLSIYHLLGPHLPHLQDGSSRPFLQEPSGGLARVHGGWVPSTQERVLSLTPLPLAEFN